MKKIISLLIALFYASFNSCFAFSELYYLKGAAADEVKPIVVQSFQDENFTLSKYDPYYGFYKYDTSEYAVVILQQSGSSSFFYYQSNDNKRINKKILKAVKKKGITYELSENANTIAIYDRLASNIMSGGNTNRYTFEEPQSVSYNYFGSTTTSAGKKTTSSTTQVPSTSLRGAVVQLSSGTTLDVYLQTSINTASANKGDRVTAVLMKDLTYNGAVIFPQGSLIHGTLTKANHATYGSRNGKVTIDFNQIVTPDNKTYSISTDKIDFNVTNEGKIASVAKNAAVGAVVGALTGLLYAALAGKDLGVATAIGAGVGAGGAAIGSTVEQGVDAEIPSFTEMELVLTKPVSVTINY